VLVALVVLVAAIRATVDPLAAWDALDLQHPS